MILLKILDHDLHKSRDKGAFPIIIETPAKPEFIPAIVSTTDSGRFIVSRHLTGDNRIRSGIFSQSQDSIDSIIGPMISAAYKLSTDDGLGNIFNTFSAAFEHIETYGGPSQPHMCLVPKRDDFELEKNFGDSLIDGKFQKICSVVQCDVKIPVFLSRPDFVGLYTQFLGGKSSILLHNIQHGMAFVELPSIPKTKKKKS